MYELAAALDCLTPPRGSRGRRSHYSTAILLAMAAASRVTGSQSSALRVLIDEPRLWQECRQAVNGRTEGGSRVPPPSRDNVLYFRKALIEHPDALGRLQDRFRMMALSQARQLGNLTQGQAVNWAQPDPRHVVYGDGTVIAPHTNVRRMHHPVTGALILDGSRASNPSRARVQQAFSALEEDGKDKHGLNMVALHTWTSAGRVVLGTGVAMRAESWAMLDLLDDVAVKAQGGVHSLVYDRAITGWHVDHLMANHRIQLIGKGVASGGGPNDFGFDDRIRHEVEQHNLRMSHPLASVLRRDVIERIVRSQDHIPVGLSIYPTTGAKYDYSRSAVVELPPAVHDTAAGPCRHDLVVDDGGLFVAAPHPDEPIMVKTQHLRCDSSIPVQRSNGRWGTETTWTIPCQHGAFTYRRTWTPDGVRHRPRAVGEKIDTTVSDPIGWKLRPLSRCDDVTHWYNDGARDRGHDLAFSRIYGVRNDAESYNQWFQSNLFHKGRAATLDPRSQELDWLLAAVVNNVRTWNNR